jgi:phosphate:Na+ symporter
LDTLWSAVSGILGGVGTFLIGMVLLTEGLKTAAGDQLREILQRSTGRRWTALLSGVAVTAAVQSSSATTVTTIGFVSAGLLSFPQALAVIFGANLGTTSTGWLVSLIGLKVSVSAFALPLVGVGALMRLLTRGRTSQVGIALAGFGLIFVGIGVLEGGMTALAARVDPTRFPGADGWGRVILVTVGVGMTVVLQSSSAAVAMTLTALSAGALTLEQSALMVIGQNIGTTVTAALASIGGSVPARRTALAHILFNVITGGVALLVFPLLLGFATRVSGGGDAATAVAVFHTSFNLLGVALLFPALGPFSRLVEWCIRERGPILTRHLDASVATVPPIAVEAARRSAMSVARLLFARCAALIGSDAPPARGELDLVIRPARDALVRIRRFFANVRTSPADSVTHDRHLNVLHALDHLDRFIEPLEDLETARYLRDGPDFVRGEQILLAALELEGVGEEALPRLEVIEHAAAELAELRKEHRANVLQGTALGSLSPDAARMEIEAIKRLDRFAYHGWRAVYHLLLADPARKAGSAVPPAGVSASTEPEVFEDEGIR